MNILITGAAGQLGSEIKEIAKNSEDYFYFTDSEELDICLFNDVLSFCEERQIDIILNCAAYTNVDGAETNITLANKINHLGVENLAKVTFIINGVLFHISTDYVFGGTKNTPLKENDKVDPLGVYGKTKRLGEEAILKSGCKYLIFRTAWLYSWRASNFVRTMLNLTKNKKEIQVVFDQVGTPTNAFDLAQTIIYIISNRLFIGNEGLYHYSNEGVCSWFDFAWSINKMSGHSCRVEPCYSVEFPTPVERPAYSVLDKTKVKSTFNLTIPYWKESLIKCLKRIKENEEI